MLKLRKYHRLAKKIFQLLPTYRAMTDETLQSQTEVLKGFLSQGKTLLEILPQAFAVVIEADKRVLGLEPYYVQVLGDSPYFLEILPKLKLARGKLSLRQCHFIPKLWREKKGTF
ncbi:hypothetical protein P9166_12560 [Lactococcus lactis]|nr:hypothetical protein P9166_12560 [Lactococcus lactis]